MHIGFDAIRIAYNLTGLGNYGRFVVGALSQSRANDHFVLYTPGLTAAACEFVNGRPNVQLRAPARFADGFYAKNFWRRYAIEAAAARDQVAIFHGLAAELPLFRKTPRPALVVTVHDLIYRRYPQYFSAIDRRLYDWRYRSAVARADVIVAISEQTRSDLIDFLSAPAEKIRVIGQGCDARFYQTLTPEQIDATLRRYNVAAPYLLFVGNAEPRKNLALCLHALAMMSPRSPRLVVVSRRTRHWTTLIALADKLRVRDRVTLLEAVPSVDLPALYQGAKLFVYPSQFEGFGIPVLEAMASGVPAITTRRSSLPEVGGDAAAYVDGRDPAELAALWRRLDESPAERKAMAERGYRRAAQFSTMAIASQLGRVYEELV